MMCIYHQHICAVSSRCPLYFNLSPSTAPAAHHTGHHQRIQVCSQLTSQVTFLSAQWSNRQRRCGCQRWWWTCVVFAVAVDSVTWWTPSASSVATVAMDTAFKVIPRNSTCFLIWRVEVWLFPVLFSIIIIIIIIIVKSYLINVKVVC